MHRKPLAWTAALLLSVASAPGGAAGGAAPEGPREKLPRELDVPYAGTPMDAVEAMHRLAGTGAGDVVFDLGCGDGRILISAVRDFDARLGVCVELDPVRLDQAREKAREAGVEERIVFVEGDLFRVDLTQATVVTLYLLPNLNERLRPKLLRELRPGSRVVSYAFGMGDWEPDAEERAGRRKVYLWTVPERDGR
ncbi:MAG TPA: class I SAM-dependent methyltransferase [Thermoanaerobaculia bacterium]|nr:class I SAM-dependent methyltransferase [Thermoanaerobaculia bacterium]